MIFFYGTFFCLRLSSIEEKLLCHFSLKMSTNKMPLIWNKSTILELHHQISLNFNIFFFTFILFSYIMSPMGFLDFCLQPLLHQCPYHLTNKQKLIYLLWKRSSLGIDLPLHSLGDNNLPLVSALSFKLWDI